MVGVGAGCGWLEEEEGSYGFVGARREMRWDWSEMASGE